MASGGTEAFPELGKHCQHSDCNQLDFLPFSCDGCQKVFCLEHRTYKSHECPKSDYKSRKVVVCEACSVAIEVTGGEDEKVILQRHEESGRCDPNKNKKKKPVCPVKRCKEALTFSNTTTCKTCHVKVCLKHRFPTDHSCRNQPPAAVASGGGWNEKFLAAFGARNCGNEGTGRGSKSSSSKTERANPSVKAY